MQNACVLNAASRASIHCSIRPQRIRLPPQPTCMRTSSNVLTTAVPMAPVSRGTLRQASSVTQGCLCTLQRCSQVALVTVKQSLSTLLSICYRHSRRVRYSFSANRIAMNIYCNWEVCACERCRWTRSWRKGRVGFSIPIGGTLAPSGKR